MNDKKAARTNFRVLFLKKLDRDGIAKSLGDLGKAIVKASGKALLRAGKRAFDFRQPSLPGLPPGQGQDLPALPPPRKEKGCAEPPAPEKTPVLSGTEKALSRSTDWRKRPLWMWISGGGWKGLLGARRYWAQATRYFLDSLGRVGWTFRVVAVIPLEFATRQAVRMSTAIPDFIRFRDAGLFHRPPKSALRRIFWSGVFPPVLGGFVLLLETAGIGRTIGIPDPLLVLSLAVGILAMIFPLLLFSWCLKGLPRHRAGDPWPEDSSLERLKNSSPLLAGLAIPSFVHSAPGSITSCVLYTFFGQSAGQNTCSQSPIASYVLASPVLQNIPAAIGIVASLVSILAMFLLTVTYSYHIVQAMHTAAHTGDWTHQGVNAAWAPVRGATSAAMIAAPGGLSILASFILFVANTGNGLGDTAATKIANMLTAPKPAAVVSPNIQNVVDNALFSLVCAHVLDNFVNPQGTVQAVTAQPDNFGNLGFSNVAGTGNYGPNVCGDYMLPQGTGQTMAQNSAFMSLIQTGGPLDSVASSIAKNANGCGSLVIGTGLSPCAPAGTASNRQVFGQGGGMTNPAGATGTLTQIAIQYETALGQMAQAGTSNGESALQNIQNDGWAALGMYYAFFGTQARRAAKTMEWLPVPTNGFGGADWSSIGASEASQEVQKAFGLTETFLSNWGFAGQAGTGPWWASTPQPMTGPGAEQAKIASLSTIIASHWMSGPSASSGPGTSPWQSISLPDYMANNPGEDPLSRLQNVVESGDTLTAVSDAAVAGLSNPTVRETLSAIPGVGMAAGIVGGAASVAKPLIEPITVAMGVLTVVVAVYLPLVPMLAILFYSLYWIMEVVLLAVFAPLWALAVGIPQGEGFIGSHGREGLSRITDVALRPLLLVGMFVISLGLYFLSAAILVPMTSQVLSSMAANPSPGIWISAAGVIGGYVAYALVLWRVIHFSFEILHTGPYWAMKILGIDGEKGREERQMDAQGLKNSFQNIGRSMGTVFRGVTNVGGK
ncbi:MAG: DotA/TraY family protein [Nitrospirota bacterium]|nr:DotA/TraY family protein [Nitrospirota bacterium]